MHEIVLRLTEAEYADLEQRARDGRRSIGDVAEDLVTPPPVPPSLADLIRAQLATIRASADAIETALT